MSAAEISAGPGEFMWLEWAAEQERKLRSCCNEFIPIYTAKQIMSMEVITSITSANYILDVIFVSLMVDNYQENVDAAVEIYKMRHGAEGTAAG